MQSIVHLLSAAVGEKAQEAGTPRLSQEAATPCPWERAHS